MAITVHTYLYPSPFWTSATPRNSATPAEAWTIATAEPRRGAPGAWHSPPLAARAESSIWFGWRTCHHPTHGDLIVFNGGQMVVFRSCSWDFTNQMVVDLFFRMGVNILSNVQKQFFLKWPFQVPFFGGTYNIQSLCKSYVRRYEICPQNWALLLILVLSVLETVSIGMRYVAIIWLGNSIRSSLAPHEKRESPSSLALSQPLMFG